MKRQFKKWTLRLITTVLLIGGLLLVIILNPILTYALKTTHNNYTVFHNKTLDPTLLIKLDQATELLKASEFYNPKLHLDICLNDGSKYPVLMRALRGQAFAWGFYDKVVLQGNVNYQDNYVELYSYKWNLTQLLTHEMIHCLQFEKLGLMKSKPIANVDNWKWEGYAEYISRQNTNQNGITININRLQQTNKNTWEITLADNMITSRAYCEYWILVQYCLDIKKMSYKQLLKDTTSEQMIKLELMKWYEENRIKATPIVL